MGRTCGIHGRDVKAYRIFVTNFKRKRLLGKPRCRWENNIKMNQRNKV